MKTSLGAEAGFAHLNVHSHYTLLGASASIKGLVRRAAQEGFSHLALTDSHALYGAVAFSKICREQGVRPIIGMTVAVAADDQGAVGAPPGLLVLLAAGPEGYRSLCKLSSRIQGSPARDRIVEQGLRWEDLETESEGLICLSGGRRGWIARCLQAGESTEAYRVAGRLAGIYQKDFYLSLELHKPSDKAIAEAIGAVGARLGVSTVAVQPVYSLNAQETQVLPLLAAIDRNCTLADLPSAALPNGGDPEISLHWLPPAEMQERFKDFPDALERTCEVAARCGRVLPGGEPIWPKLRLPDGQQAQEALSTAAHAGLRRKYDPDPEIRRRLTHELETLDRSGFAPLFLVVADIVRFAREAEVPVSTRGSVANSLVAYCVDITTVDPIDHDLLFERFLNPARRDLPDIDLDFCSRKRDQILDYVRRTYGEDRVALVATISRMRPRSAVRETAKAHGLEESQINRLAGLVPRRRRRKIEVEEILSKLEDPRLQQVVRDAFSIVGKPHHLSVHPGGVVITPGPLTEVVPVQWAPKGFLITQFDHRDLEAIGLPKLDLLGVRALTVLADSAEWVRRDHDRQFKLEAIPMEDNKTGDLLSSGETIGIFQCESTGARRTLRRLQARTVRDLAIANAFFKPGPSMGGMARTFERRYRGEEAVAYLHPSLQPILAVTKGVLIFQEQVLRIGREVAGLSWAQADHLRRGISKFRREEMAELENQFLRGCRLPPPEGPGMNAAQARQLWEQVLAFSGYGFNQGHATAYADVSYRSAYVKAHWPAAFLCARLADRGGYHHPAVYMAEARRLGIRLRPPHVNQSGDRFTLSWEGKEHAPVLWMGLGQIRDVRRDSVAAMLAERKQARFRDLPDLLGRVSLHPKEVTHIIQCGALDGLDDNRAALLQAYEQIQRAGGGLQMAFSFADKTATPETPAQRLAWERHLLGHPVSVHPLDLVNEDLPAHVPLQQLADHAGQPVTTIGIRLPGWTGGKGFFLGDKNTFLVARREEGGGLPPVYQPLQLRGRWIGDGLGTFWFAVDSLRSIGEA